MTDDLTRTIHDLETELLQPRVRTSPARLDALLADDFREFGASGRVFSKREIIELLPPAPKATYTVHHFEAVEISGDTVLATYCVERATPDSDDIVASLRSSIWRKRDGEWRMTFHQGTLRPADLPSGRPQ